MQKIKELPEDGFVRLSTVLAVFPVSKSTWWAGVKEGIFPKPVKLTKRTTAWRVEEIRELLLKSSNYSSLTNTNVQRGGL